MCSIFVSNDPVDLRQAHTKVACQLSLRDDLREVSTSNLVDVGLSEFGSAVIFSQKTCRPSFLSTVLHVAFLSAKKQMT